MSANKMPANHFRILGISGSVRRGSFNSALLRAAQELVGEGVLLEIHDLSRLPMFNEDLESEPPPIVAEFKAKVKGADAILFATPEYNYSISGALKNAIEWGNKPDGDNSWDGKPAAILSASTGPRGGARAQLHLRQIMVDLNMHPINDQVFVARAQEKFDAGLTLTDPKLKDQLRNLLAALVQWGQKLNASS